MVKGSIDYTVEGVLEFVARTEKEDMDVDSVKRKRGEDVPVILLSEIEAIKAVVADKPMYTFNENEEKDFIDFINEYIKVYGYSVDNINYNCDKSVRVSQVIKFIWNNSKANLDPNKLWHYFDKNHKYGFNDMLDVIRMDIFERIDFDTFQKEVNGLSNYNQLYEHYIYYALGSKQPREEMIEKYFDHLDNVLATSSDDEKEKINLTLIQLFCIWISDIVNKGILERSGEKQRLIIEVIRKFLPRINFDFIVSYMGHEVDLGNLFGCAIANTSLLSIAGMDTLISEFLNLNPKVDYKNGKITTNAIELSAMIGDVNRIRNLINSDIELYSIEKYNRLKAVVSCPVGEFGNPGGLITWRIPNERFAHGDLLELLCCGKVKMLSMQIILHIVKNGYLDPLELKSLLDYIQENDVLVYDYINGKITIIDDVYTRLGEIQPVSK